MSKGSAGLTKRRAETSTETLRDESVSNGAWEYATPARHGSLHLVDIDRRAPDRFNVELYGTLVKDRRWPYFALKRIFDLAGAAIGLTIFSPLIAVIVAISILSGNKPIFKHRRVGQNGIFFNCLKFRTMVPNANQVLQDLLDSDRQIKEEWLRDHKLRNDPRVTRLGRFLRITSLDELPQLWNVLRGEMSLVGPRPVVPEELARYGKKVGIFLSATPGVTGLWQVSGRNDNDYRRRVALDVCYVRSRSLILDVYILLKTLPAVFAKSGAY